MPEYAKSVTVYEFEGVDYHVQDDTTAGYSASGYIFQTVAEEVTETTTEFYPREALKCMVIIRFNNEEAYSAWLQEEVEAEPIWYTVKFQP